MRQISAYDEVEVDLIQTDDPGAGMLTLVFDADPRPFHGVMPYRDGRMVSWSYSRL